MLFYKDIYQCLICKLPSLRCHVTMMVIAYQTLVNIYTTQQAKKVWQNVLLGHFECSLQSSHKNVV